MALFHRRQAITPLEPEPIPVPRPSIDGWTLAGTSLVAKLSKPDLRELEILLHGIAVSADTPYTYERAAILLERAGEPGPAISVCDVWLSLPAGSSRRSNISNGLARSPACCRIPRAASSSARDARSEGSRSSAPTIASASVRPDAESI